MEMQFVDSRAMDQMGYDPDNQELHIVFKGCRRCIYSQVPPEIWDGLQNAPSEGTYLTGVVKANGYPFRYD